ncbi:3-hydroxyisobutyrate dehydrogenase [Pseudochelatococcus lubricantis]|uniref:3-hydroxyisobutyrate dehydrogenase n=2 Tax=Pseudochelatococcus lubricantis TaxID=1538102 RepID=A0ABX0UYJ7_9HYPH|nr:3-hydroxyisobutyrate dehydrogenase [Pseudochelatococcus lubricantis]
MSSTIGFIGLGNMGGPMAANLVKAHHKVTGFDVAPAAREAAKEAGVVIAASAAETVAEADVIVTMLPNGRLVLGVWNEIAAHVKPEALIIDSSTIDVDSARNAHGLFAASGHLTLDAPVSGGTVGAQAATLTFMAGGSKPAFARAEPILLAMGKRAVHCGEAGAGQAAKICNNMILGISMIGVAEAFVLGEKLGLTHEALFNVASTSSGQCWALTTNCPVPGPVPTSPANRDYRPGFAAALMLKDMKLSQDAALSSGAATPLGAHATQLFDLFDKLGHGNEDFSAIIRFLRGGTGGGN